MITERTFWHCADIAGSDQPQQPYDGITRNDAVPVEWPQANLIGSLLSDEPDTHGPALDIDWPCQLDNGRLTVAVARSLRADKIAKGLRNDDIVSLMDSGFSDNVRVTADTEHGFEVAMKLQAPALLLESRTPGNYHLYTEHRMSGQAYHGLLRGLVALDVVQPGFATAATIRGMSHLRIPKALDGVPLEDVERTVAALRERQTTVA